MKFHRFSRIARGLFAGLVIVFSSASSFSQQPTRTGIDLTPVKPETVGFSSERLERLHALMQQAVDQQQVAGVVTILARHGKVADYRTYGQRDIAAARR